MEFIQKTHNANHHRPSIATPSVRTSHLSRELFSFFATCEDSFMDRFLGASVTSEIAPYEINKFLSFAIPQVSGHTNIVYTSLRRAQGIEQGERAHLALVFISNF